MSPLVSHASHPAHVVSVTHAGLHVLYRAAPIFVALYTLGRTSLSFRMPYRKAGLPRIDEGSSTRSVVACQITPSQNRRSHKGRKSRAGIAEVPESQELQSTKH